MLGDMIPKELHDEVSVALSSFSMLLVVATGLPWVRSDYWTFRALEYPRFQKLLLCLALLAAWVLLWPQVPVAYYISTALLAGCAGYLFYKIIPYTKFYPIEMKRVEPDTKDNVISFFTANVFQGNRDYDRIITQIGETDPDVILLLETDRAWAEAMQSLKQEYPYFLEQPRDNTYGLLFYSRFPLQNGKVVYRVKDDIPSIEATVILPSGQPVKVYGLHPEPPAPNEALKTTAKDKELMLVAFEAKKCTGPVVVLGDLNDVAWSYTTELFRKTSRLLDPRRGRGFYSTFNANSRFVRFPLDYIFCSDDFGLVEMRRMPYHGSDHFAMFTCLQYDKKLKRQQETAKADGKELKDAREKAAQ
jgi:endonuclease/exonuclease/phosphatase (EEP) superfamily protein YafD